MPPPSAHGACPRHLETALQEVEYVYDGDTLLLEGGSRVRLAGINTPELGRRPEQTEPFSVRARNLLRTLVEKSEHRVRVTPASEDRDRYGRLLGHVYTADGLSLQEIILQSGFGLSYFHPPNLGNLDCYRAAEHVARARRKGIWRQLPLESGQLDHSHRGFVLISGRVEQLFRNRRSTWIELEGGVALRIAEEDAKNFPAPTLDSLIGVAVEARGWVSPFRGRPRIRVRHASALELRR